MIDHTYVPTPRSSATAGAGAACAGTGRRVSGGRVAVARRRDRGAVPRPRRARRGWNAKPPMLCHARATARRLDMRRCSPRSICSSCSPLSIRRGSACRRRAALPRRSACRRRAARPRLASLSPPRRARCSKQLRPGNRSRSPRDRRGDGARRLAVGPGGARRLAARRNRRVAASGRPARVDKRSTNGRSTAPPPPPGNAAGLRRGGARPPRRAARRRRRAAAAAEPITPPRSPPPLLRASIPDQPQAVLAEAGTGVGKTLGYIAPASLWAEKNRGSVWISTYTRNLQTQIAGELDRLYPDPECKARRVVVRKGRENFLCLLNYEDARRAGDGPRRARPVGAARADRALDRSRPRRATWSPAISRAGSPS